MKRNIGCLNKNKISPSFMEKRRKITRKFLETKYNFYLKYVPSFIKNFFGKKKIKKWITNGKIPPPPQEYKHQIIRIFAQKHNCKIFIETGTYKGETLYTMKDFFDELHSIELSDLLYKKALGVFRGIPHVSLIHGDSGKQLKLLLKKIKHPALFWLDAHYSGGITVKGKQETPIMSEVKTIFSHNLKHTILIDDARCFVGKNDYPTLEQLAGIVKRSTKYNHFEAKAKDDIIRIW
jgi:hypothetical protein